MSDRLGELLVRENLISLGQLKEAQQQTRKSGERLAYTLTKLGMVGEGDLTAFLSKHYGVPSINLEEFEIDDDVIKLIPRDLARQHQILPINRAGSSLIVAMSDPSNLNAVDDVKFHTGYNVEVVVASEEAIRLAIEHYYDQSAKYEEIMEGFDPDEVEVAEEEDEPNVVDLEKSSEEAPVVRLVNLILVDAIKKNASDIHIEPYEKSFRVRYRIDGVLYEIMNPPLKLKNAITSRVKIMSALDIAERRLPQDGRIKIKLGGGKEMDFRVSVLPTLFGEKIVLRLLDKSNLQLDMTKLGFFPEQIETFKEAIYKPYGMVLVTGPTGSGKTTTLYSALSDLNKATENISTAEDPVEINLWAASTSVNMQRAGQRAELSPPPSEIFPAAGPGHHHGGRDSRLRDRGDRGQSRAHRPPGAVHAAHERRALHREPAAEHGCRALPGHRLGQRDPRPAPGSPELQGLHGAPRPRPTAAHRLGMTPEQAKAAKPMKGNGCRTCNDTGYKGRTAFYEIMPMSDDLKDMILQGVSSVELKREAIALG